MPIPPQSFPLRAKKLGVLIRDARQSAGRSIDDCAAALEIPPDDFEAFELGSKSPSLPTLEALAFYLHVPLEQFWSAETLSAGQMGTNSPDLKQRAGLRQRIIGALIRQARQQNGLSAQELASQMGLDEARLTAYELGQTPIPLPELEALSQTLDRPLRDFQDKSTPIGIWVAQQRVIGHFAELPPDLQEFVGKPINRPYLELAQRLSEMPVDQLRAIGEGILEITL